MFKEKTKQKKKKKQNAIVETVETRSNAKRPWHAVGQRLKNGEFFFSK